MNQILFWIADDSEGPEPESGSGSGSGIDDNDDDEDGSGKFDAFLQNNFKIYKVLKFKFFLTFNFFIILQVSIHIQSQKLQSHLHTVQLIQTHVSMFTRQSIAIISTTKMIIITQLTVMLMWRLHQRKHVELKRRAHHQRRGKRRDLLSLTSCQLLWPGLAALSVAPLSNCCDLENSEKNSNFHHDFCKLIFILNLLIFPLSVKARMNENVSEKIVNN